MKKSLSYLSLVTVVVLLGGCGGSDGGGSDVDAPKFTNSTYMFTPDELKKETVELSANESVTFTENSSDATITGSSLIFTAPSYVVGGTNSYKVTVTAKDAAGNLATKDFTFNVQNVITETYEANASYVAPIGNKDFVAAEGNLKDGSGLLWKDGDSGTLTYENAKSYCERNAGWRLPTRGELLNLMDYSKGNNTGTKSLIDSSFTAFSNDNFDASWVEKIGDDKIVVNHKSGGDTQSGTGADFEHRVMCVYGEKADSHDFEGLKDNTTGLEWSEITNATYGDYSDIANICTGEYSLPTINELRSIIVDNRIRSEVAPTEDPRIGSTSYSIWSATEVKNDANATTLGKAYYVIDIKEKSGVTSDRANQTHHVTCVKRP